MAFCSKGSDSDIAVYQHCDGYYCCSRCSLRDSYGDFNTARTKQILNHIQEHIEQGDTVPPSAIESIKKNAQPNEDWNKIRLRQHGKGIPSY